MNTYDNKKKHQGINKIPDAEDSQTFHGNKKIHVFRIASSLTLLLCYYHFL